MSDEKNDVLTIWIPLIGAIIMFVAVYIISMNFDNNFYSDTGSRLFEPGFNVLLGIVLSVVMFFFFRSSGKKAAKKK